MAVNVQDFFFCIHEEISFEIKRRPFLLLSLIVHNKGSFLALQEDLYWDSTVHWSVETKCFYRMLCILERNERSYIRNAKKKKKNAAKSQDLLP